LNLSLLKKVVLSRFYLGSAERIRLLKKGRKLRNC
jgi:hypothetical protein